MMTYLTLRRTDRFRAAVVGAGMADAISGIEQRPEMAEHVYSELVPGWDDLDMRRRELENRSAVLWAEELPAGTPILLLHGTADWRVDPTQALDMSRALLEARRPYRLQMFEGGDHGLSEYQDEVDTAVLGWFDHYVRDRGTHPDLEPHGR
jgi:dipeptidyl aminopeptidase/acylaminoacyl peptidase